MTAFRMKLAGFPFEVHCLFENTKVFCFDYLTDEEPEFQIELTQIDIDNEREISRQQDLRDGKPVQNYSDAYLETIALYRKLAKPMLDRDCIIFHGSAVAVDESCYLFTAKSGTGKTTHTNLWLKNIKKSFILNGDKPLIKIGKSSIMICGSPWRGKENYGCNCSVPLKAISILQRAKDNHIEPIQPTDAFQVLYQQTHHMDDVQDMAKTLHLLDILICNTKLYRLGCNMEDDAALLSYQTMRSD